jgi:hypothetical protein
MQIQLVLLCVSALLLNSNIYERNLVVRACCKFIGNPAAQHLRYYHYLTWGAVAISRPGLFA